MDRQTRKRKSRAADISCYFDSRTAAKFLFLDSEQLENESATNR